jgi:hypothetical protein
MRSPISSSALHSAILASLALGAASGVSLGQAFSVAPAHPSGATVRNDYTGTPSLGANPYFRISNINGLVAAPSPDSALATVASATTAGPANIDNYLNRVGQFTFTADNPILNVSLTLGVNSIYTENFGASGNLVGGDNFFDRSAFLLHDFGLLFEGNGGARFALTRFTDPAAGRFSADENFAVVELAGGGFTIEFIDPPNLDVNGELIPLTDQIRSLEWLGVGANDAAWDPTGDSFPFDDTFPVAADAAIPPTFFMERGIDTGADPLYTGGGNNTVWNVYLFSTGPIGSNLQLNLSEIQVTLSVPEASDALAAGVGLILVAGVIRSRMRA